MKTRGLIAITAILALVISGSLSNVRAETQQQSPPNKDNKTGTIPERPLTPPNGTIRDHGGAPGSANEAIVDHASVIAQVDSMMQQMTLLQKRTQSYSKSFAELAANHHGADKKEILMMQRMSDSMGMMAREISVSLHQYKDMLEDETSSESGPAKAEVLNFKFILDSIARNVQGAVNTLQELEARLGQG